MTTQTAGITRMRNRNTVAEFRETSGRKITDDTAGQPGSPDRCFIVAKNNRKGFGSGQAGYGPLPGYKQEPARVI
jgi:hypothetical protein